MQQSRLSETVDKCKDIIAHPDDDMEYISDLIDELFTNEDINNINSALSTIINDKSISDSKRKDLIENSWKINDKFKCPSPSEFLTEKWIGPMSKDLYPHIRQLFLDFFNPLINKNKLIMYCCTGYGKSTVLTLCSIS